MRVPDNTSWHCKGNEDFLSPSLRLNQSVTAPNPRIGPFAPLLVSILIFVWRRAAGGDGLLVDNPHLLPRRRGCLPLPQALLQPRTLHQSVCPFLPILSPLPALIHGHALNQASCHDLSIFFFLVNLQSWSFGSTIQGKGTGWNKSREPSWFYLFLLDLICIVTDTYFHW